MRPGGRAELLPTVLREEEEEKNQGEKADREGSSKP